jgi:hypothetical protein
VLTPSLCFNTSEECEIAEENLGGIIPNISDCEGVEALPPSGTFLICVNIEEEETVRCGPVF